MKNIIIYFIRFIIIFLVALPVIFPFLKGRNNNEKKEEINLLIDNRNLTINENYILKKKLKDKFGRDINIRYNFFGDYNDLVVQDYEKLIDKINSIKTKIVILTKANLFGDDSVKLNYIIRNLSANKENRLYFLNENKVLHKKNDEKYIVLSSLFLPKTIFLNSESLAVLNLLGRGSPNEKIKLNVDLYNESSFLNSKKIEIKVPENGIINQIVEVPVQFSKIGTHTLIAKINTSPEISFSPLNTAFTFANVTYSKTTVLHLGYAPDWNLRQLRWKLKFWPNFDLLSYYILRDISSDNRIPSSQLSLIEFPSQKLFGSRLANLHGLVAQNFMFENFVGSQELKNINSYLKKGGRLVLLAGPASFLDKNESVKEFFPCENKPELDQENSYHWKANNKDIFLPHNFEESLNHISGHSTFIKCIPKKNVLVLAKLKETGDPVLTAMPLGKGIVVTFLASDWISYYTSLPSRGLSQNILKVNSANATDALFQWLVEFLQRKQDGSLRAPNFAGPRIYSLDKFLPIKSAGGLNLNQKLFVQKENSNKKINSSPFILHYLSEEILQLEKPLQNFEDIQKGVENLEKMKIAFENESEPLVRFNSMPVIYGMSKDLETVSNPFLFEGVLNIEDENEDLQNQDKDRENIPENSIPFSEKYPWILGLVLGLLAVEQWLSRGSKSYLLKSNS